MRFLQTLRFFRPILFNNHLRLIHKNTKSLSWLPDELENYWNIYKTNIYVEFTNLTHLISHQNCDVGITKRWNELNPIIDTLDELDVLAKTDEEVDQLIKEITGTENKLEDDDDGEEICAIANLERKQRSMHCKAMEQRLYHQLVPNDEIDFEPNVILELVAGAGGTEAALFATNLIRMYHSFALKRNWTFTVQNMSNGNLDSGHETPISHARIRIEGFPSGSNEFQSLGAYGQLRSEAGVHRVQRVPLTSKQNKIHTSTVAVSVLPSCDDFEIDLPEKDLKWEYFRASGPGGQHVNKTDSAVRLTHLPSGLTTVCKRERHQHINKSIALNMLVERLRDIKVQSKLQEINSLRRSHVGNLDRSEKIRTYNFPQDRITDHRLNQSCSGIQRFMVQSIGLDEFMEAFYQMNRLNRLKDVLIQSNLTSSQNKL